MSIATRIRQARVDADLTQQELAHRAGLALQTVSNAETERHSPSYETLYRLGKALEVDLLDEFIRQAANG